ncbi:ATP synthase epsilon chain, chloroplastic [Capsicum baccatum]|uniref:ATP synthase epsilon chain, chloroplastic n=1 Tax=Capsicum baccatum TaxID=33114 RepID=A0A2G2WSY3_CAPBA|nr:ATP synthase epsilon chain, chloroplastic [Capsicum baccatum]
MALMGGFARIGNNEITVLVNDAEKGSDIDPQEAQQTLEIAKANVKKAEGRRQKIEANLALRRARTQRRKDKSNRPMIDIPLTVTVPLSKQNKSNTPALFFGDSISI